MASEHERIAKAFHDEYEARAPQHGYETREASAVPWEQVPEANRNLMVGTVAALLRQGVIYPASVLEERDRDLAECNDNFDTVEQAAMAAQTEAESLRSQLTEARARFAELDSNETHPDNLDYVASNVLVLLDVLLDLAPGLNSGDWFHQLRNWAARNRSGLMEPNYLAEHLRTYLRDLGLTDEKRNRPEDRS